ncbi:hypothetical protein N9S49_00300 [Rhodobiaceae bacterium]|nr:hypothetical protein [Rhodobiaceae bacterium]
MKKYILMPIILALFTLTKVDAAPLDAYYCFSTEDPQAVVEKMDNFLTSESAKGLPTIRLWSMLLNGESPETHCVVFSHPSGDSFEKSGLIFQSQAGQDFLKDLYSVSIDGLEGAGTPMLNFGNVDFKNNPYIVLYNVRVKNAKRYGEVFSEFMSSADLPGSATLYQDTFTGEDNRTHYIVMSGPSVDVLTESISSMLNAPSGQTFQKRAGKIRKLISTNLMFHIKSWND